MTDDPTKKAGGDAESAGARPVTPPLDALPQAAAVERIIARDFREAVAIDDLTHELVGALLRLVESGVSIAELGAPDEVADMMIGAIRLSTRSSES